MCSNGFQDKIPDGNISVDLQYASCLSTRNSFHKVCLQLTLYMPGNVCVFVFCRFVFKISTFPKIFQEHYQSVKRFVTRSGPTRLSVLIWIQTVCKGYQQLAKVAASRERVKSCMGSVDSHNLSYKA